jgi:hypothetical protein
MANKKTRVTEGLTAKQKSQIRDLKNKMEALSMLKDAAEEAGLLRKDQKEKYRKVKKFTDKLPEV